MALTLNSILLSADSLSVEVSTQPRVQNGYLYEKPGLFDFVRHVPCDLVACGSETFSRENLLPIGLVVASTALLLAYDQKIVDGAHHAGDQTGITHSNRMETAFKIPIPFTKTKLKFEGPHDSGSALYFLGDGWVDIWIAGGFLGTGLVADDNRALQTSSQIVESIICSGLVTQLVKHVTGRESPYVATQDGGKWHPFPDQQAYADNVPHYDAFSSGHMAAAMATVTVIATNYEEYRFVRPVGYTLMGALGFQMLNNGVHWASDYPLAIAIGYGFGKITTRRGRRAAPKDKKSTAQDDTNMTILVVDGSPGLGVRHRF